MQYVIHITVYLTDFQPLANFPASCTFGIKVSLMLCVHLHTGWALHLLPATISYKATLSNQLWYSTWPISFSFQNMMLFICRQYSEMDKKTLGRKWNAGIKKWSPSKNDKQFQERTKTTSRKTPKHLQGKKKKKKAQRKKPYVHW